MPYVRPPAYCFDCKKTLTHCGNKRKNDIPRRCFQCWKIWRTENPNHTKLYKGGRWINKRLGYVYVMAKDHPFAINGYIREHRLVMEKTIGRLLAPTEVVHHINGIKTDNRPENLVLCQTNSDHIKDFHPRATCAFHGCGKSATGLGYCQMHYQRVKNHGSPLGNPHGRFKRGPQIKCETCSNPAKTMGLCAKCYDKKRSKTRDRRKHKVSIPPVAEKAAEALRSP